jgi:hypothetical protein
MDSGSMRRCRKYHRVCMRMCCTMSAVQSFVVAFNALISPIIGEQKVSANWSTDVPSEITFAIFDPGRLKDRTLLLVFKRPEWHIVSKYQQVAQSKELTIGFSVFGSNHKKELDKLLVDWSCNTDVQPNAFVAQMVNEMISLMMKKEK